MQGKVSTLAIGRHRVFVGYIKCTVTLLAILFLDMKQDATDRFMRDTICGCYGAERFFLLHHTMHDGRPVFSGNTVVRLFWPWSPFASQEEGWLLEMFIFRQQVLHLEIQFPRRGKEEVENW